jgi:hypothetical protein
MFQQKQGSYADLSDSNILELMKSNGLDVSFWHLVCLCDDQLRKLTSRAMLL